MTGRRLFEFYSEATYERDRLRMGRGQLELVRTQQLLRRLLPAPRRASLKRAAARERNAAWLAVDGYDVQLIDLVPELVEHAALRRGRRAGALAAGRQPRTCSRSAARLLRDEATAPHRAIELRGRVLLTQVPRRAVRLDAFRARSRRDARVGPHVASTRSATAALPTQVWTEHNCESLPCPCAKPGGDSGGRRPKPPRRSAPTRRAACVRAPCGTSPLRAATRHRMTPPDRGPS